jgi:Ca-activated chloride channel homolog
MSEIEGLLTKTIRAASLLIELTGLSMAALGLAQIADRAMTYVQLPEIAQHTVTLPLSVNVVPADLAAGAGDVAGAQAALLAASGDICAAPPACMSDELRDGLGWLEHTAAGLEDWSQEYSTKRLHSDHNSKSRGYKNRTQGGEV